MKPTSIKEALRREPSAAMLCLQGWVRTLRASKEVVFLNVNDGSCLSGIQIVADESLDDLADLRKVTTGSAVRVTGQLVQSPAKGQRVELRAATVEVLGLAEADYPLQKKRHGFEFLRTIPHLRIRTNTYGAVFRVRHRLALATHQFFDQRGFVYLHTPIITAHDAEGAGELFRVTTLHPKQPPLTETGEVDWHEDFFARQAYLTVSGQLDGEAYALGMTNIYTFGPTFRAENSNTSRHAAEFWMIEPEMAFCDLAQNCDVAEAYIKHLIQTLFEACEDDLAFFDQRIDKGLIERLRHVLETCFERLSYAKAVELLQASGEHFEYPVSFGANLQAEHERYLTEKAVGRPCFVTDYPKDIKAFYMRRNADDKTVAAMDLLVPGVGELVGGSQREERHDVLQHAMQEHGLCTEQYRWYLDTRRYGTAPHSGFGLGFERMVMYATGMQNIRDVIAFPRTPRNCA